MAKKYAGGGFVGAAGTNRGAWSGDGDLGVRTGTRTGTTASNRVEAKTGRSTAPGQIKKANKPSKPAAKAAPAAPKKPNYSDVVMFKKPGTGTNWPGQANRNPGAPGTANPEGKGDREMRKGGVVKGRKTFGKRMADGGMSMVGNMPTTGVRSKRVTAPLPKRGKPGVIEGDRGRMPGGMPGRGMGKRGNELPGRRIGQIGMLRGKRPPMIGGDGVAVKEVSPGVAPTPQDMANARPMPMPSISPKMASGISPVVRRPRISSGDIDLSQAQPMGMKKGGKVKSGKDKGENKYGGGVMNRNIGLGLNPPRPVTTNPGMGLGLRGGGLARKGVGQALAKGGLVKGAGCAQRGVKKPRMK